MDNYDILKKQVIDERLCTHCGTCVGLSQGKLVFKDSPNGPIPAKVVEDVLLANEALLACPSYQPGYPDLYRYTFGELPKNWLAGNCKGSYISYATDQSIRQKGASGGVISQVLIHLLETNQIDGAVVVQQGIPEAWSAKAVIARNRDEVLAASQSVYKPVPVNEILNDLQDFKGRLAFVGLPDQVASIRRLQQLNHPSVSNIEYIIGPYVGTNMVFEAVRSYLRSQGVRDWTKIVHLRYREGEWPGYLYIKLDDGREFKAEKFYYNYLIPFYVTNGTIFAVDFTNELTDISVGDAWHPKYEATGKGFSVVLARSLKGQEILREMQRKNLIVLDEIPLDEALSMHGHMLDFKKRGSFIRMGWRGLVGRRQINYGYRPSHIPLSRYLVEVIISSAFLIGRTKLARWVVEKIPIRIIGPLFNQLRITWKQISKPTKRNGLSAIQFEET